MSSENTVNDTATVAEQSDGQQPGARPSRSERDRQLAEELVAQASEDGVDLVGPDGLLTGVTKRVLEAGLEAEITERLGYAKHAPEGRDGGNSRNGTRAKTVLTEIGPVPLDVPRDREGSFEPQLVKKRQRRLHGVDEMIISLTAKGLTTGEVQAHLAEVYGTQVSRETISKVTDAIIEEMNDWLNRPLEQVYAAVFIDAIVVKVRDGQVTNRPAYTAIGVTAEGTRDILGIWMGDGGEGAKFWLQVLTEIKNRGTNDVCIVVCDGLKGLPDAIETTWPLAIIQTCVLHLIRNTFRYASRADWDKMARDLRPIYTAPSEQAVKERLGEFNELWGEKYPAITRLWENTWTSVRPVPRLRRRDPPGHLLHQRHRVAARPDATSDPSARALPQRTGSAQVPLHGGA